MAIESPAVFLQRLGESFADLSKSMSKNDPDPAAPESGVFLFLSFDLAGSTAFKAEHPSLWASVFTSFYSQVLDDLGVEDYKTPNNDDDDPVCVRKLWKLIGDEVLIFDPEGRILLHTDPAHGWETGCLKRISDAGSKSWKELCEEGYKEKYDIEIRVATCPIPIATYHTQNGNALGLIIMADYAGDPAAVDKKKGWGFYTADAVKNSTGPTAPPLKEAVHRAQILRGADAE